MNESDVRDYLNRTQARAYEAERRLEHLQDMKFKYILRRRGPKSGVVGHSARSVMGVALLRRTLREASERLAVLENEVEMARDRLHELEEERRQEEEEKQRQAEALRKEQEAAQAAEWLEERDRADRAEYDALILRGQLQAEKERSVDLELTLSSERLEREQEDGDREDPGDREGPDPQSGPGRGPRGPRDPDGDGGGAETPEQENKESDKERDGDRENDYEREM